jgi:sugar phosphate isomerase/epimerase
MPQSPPPPLEAKFGLSAPPRTAPMVCLHSANVAKAPYFDLGNVASQLGYEGVDLTVYIGGHVDPRVTNVDLIRAFESIRGVGLEVPMITTSITSPGDGTIYPVLYLTGHSQIPLFRLGFWQYGPEPVELRLAMVRQELRSIVATGQSCGIAAMFQNRAGGYVGQSTWDAESVVAQFDPRWLGHCFDPAEAMIEGGAGGWLAAFRLALPRLKSLSLQDFYWEKSGGSWVVRKCPLGEGMVDWTTFFNMAAAAKFTGPMSIRMEYAPQDAFGAMTRDAEFVKSQIQRAWPRP